MKFGHASYNCHTHKSLLIKLHNLFNETREALTEIRLWNGTVTNTSKPFYAKFIKEVQNSNCSPTFDASVLTDIQDALQTYLPHHPGFVAAVLTALAKGLLDRGELATARPLAERAVAVSQYDLFAQAVLLQCRGLQDTGRDTLAETDAWLRSRFCPMPFEALESTTAGEFVVCCPLWLPVSIGTVDDEDIAAVVGSASAVRLRQSILDGSFSHCSRYHCAKIVARDLPSRETIDLKAYQDRTFPREVVFSHDLSCNLSCPSCRGERIIVPKAEQDRFDVLSDRFFLPLMHHADSVKICGSGDPFASTHFRNLMRQFCAQQSGPTHRLILHTNGVLCDAQSWRNIGLAGHVKKVMVSLDAASASTYHYTRRGGDWDRLLRNLAFLAELRRTQGIAELEILFVVQAVNFREMPAAIAIARSFGADQIVFQQLTNWGTYTPDAFGRHDIFSNAHADHGEFRDQLDGALFDDPIVNLWNIVSHRRSGSISRASSSAE